MKKRLHFLCMLAVLLPLSAWAEISLKLSGEEFAACSPVDFVIGGETAESYRYAVLKDDKTLFSTEVQRAAGSYLPRETGEYTMQVTALYADGEESAQAGFIVTDPLSMTLNELPDTIRTGEALKVHVEAAGGAGEKRCIYAVTAENETLERTMGGMDWHWVPEKTGEYELHVTVQDEQEACAAARATIVVEAGGGLSVESTGGELGAGGGQKSWTIYSVEPWTAQTDSAFLKLENTSGQSGDVLTVTVETPTAEYREGTILLHSGVHQYTLTAAQSAGHRVDEEVSLFAPVQAVYIDGQTHAVWTNAQEDRFFRVDAQEEWHAETQDPFIWLEEEEDGLTVSIEENGEASVRCGLVTLTSGGSSAYIHVYQPPAVRTVGVETAQQAPPPEQEITLYSQSSGYWKDRKYGASDLQKSGCAIFALSHALQQLGFEGESIAPEALAKKYAFCLREDGTINSTLVGNAGDDLGFHTRYDLYHDLRTIRSKAEAGAVFSFAVVSGHIAMAAEISADGSMVRVIDSAPSATWERIGGNRLYIEQDGGYVPVDDLADIPGIRYYPETDAFGAATYWLESSYVARRGVRLIQPQ